MRSSTQPSLRPRRIRAPSRGTNGRQNSRWTTGWACFAAWPWPAPPRPMDTIRRGCLRVAANKDWSRRRDDCAACSSPRSDRMRLTIAEVLSMPDPSNAAQLPVLRLRRNEDRRLHAGHLWIFSNEVDTKQTPLVRFKPGDLARVLAHNDRAIGLAYVNPQSLICARLLGTWQIPDA